MTAPLLSVQIGFNANPALGDFFVLDDPVMGVLDNATYTLAGSAYVDVTQWCSGQIAVTRGRSRQTDQYQCGTASFTLRNEDRRFDPTNTASPYAPGLLPRLPVNIYFNCPVFGPGGVGGYSLFQIFGGYIDDIQIQYVEPNICTVTVSCLDAFTLLANSFLNNFPSPAGTSGAAITAVLGAAAFPASASIDTGLASVQSSTQNNVAALSFAQSLATSENGDLYVDRSGVLQFVQRNSRRLNSYLTVTDDPTVAAGIPYQAIALMSQSLLLYNRVTGTRTGGTLQEADNASSQSSYLLRQLQLPQLENATDTDVLALCEYLVGVYSQPDVRFGSVTIELQSVNPYTIGFLAEIDLTSLITVERTPPGSGTPSKISLLSVVEGISYSFDVSASAYRMTLNLGTTDAGTVFVLDDPAMGVLDNATYKLSY